MANNLARKKISAAYRYSFSRLALNYDILYELISEDPELLADFGTVREEFDQILTEFLAGAGSVQELDALRRRITAQMEVYTVYADCFQLYEYVLNRMERRFLDLPLSEMTPAEFAQAAAEKIVSSRDAAVMRDRMQTLLAQLPVRYTRQKFFGMMLERMTVLAGSARADLEDYIQRLRSSAMLHLPEAMGQYPELYEALEQFRQADFKHMEEPEYRRLVQILAQVSQTLQDATDTCLLLEELINDLYVLLLCQPEALRDGSEESLLIQVIRKVMEDYDSSSETAMDEVTRLLAQTEGIQEDAMERFAAADTPLEGELAKIDRLLSSSAFASLEDADRDTQAADNLWIEQRCRGFFDELEELFRTVPRQVTRAVMASLLSQTPPVMTSFTELRTAIQNSLESCDDAAERETAMELLKQDLLDDEPDLA